MNLSGKISEKSHTTTLGLFLAGLAALLGAAAFPSIRWQAVWTMIALVILEILETLAGNVRPRERKISRRILQR